MKMAGSSQPMCGLTVGWACIKMVPLKSARKTAYATIFVQKYFGNCYGLMITGHWTRMKHPHHIKPLNKCHKFLLQSELKMVKFLALTVVKICATN